MRCLALLVGLSFLLGCVQYTMNQSSAVKAPITPASTVRKPPIQTGPVTIQTQTGGSEPTQLATRQIEVRRLEAPYDVSWRAATQAMFTLGYSIEHSEKTSGILNGSRMVGVEDFEQETRRRQEEFTQKQEEYKQKQKEWERKRDEQTALSMIPYVGIFAAMSTPKPPEFPEMDNSPIPKPKSLQMTMFLKSLDEKSTEIRFKMQIDGEPAWDPVVIDKLWVTTEREAMIEEGPSPSSGPITSGSTSQPPTGAIPTASSGTLEATSPPPVSTPPGISNKVYTLKHSGIFHRKDSRVFHRRNCSKIAHLLEGKELTEFSSPEEALKAGGSPCDACKP